MSLTLKCDQKLVDDLAAALQEMRRANTRSGAAAALRNLRGVGIRLASLVAGQAMFIEGCERWSPSQDEAVIA